MGSYQTDNETKLKANVIDLKGEENHHNSSLGLKSSPNFVNQKNQKIHFR